MMKNFTQLSMRYKLAAAFIVCIIAAAIFAPWLAPYDPVAVSTEEILQPPSVEHWLGTDALGRDILSRLIFGAGTSVAFAVAAACCTMFVGVAMGMLGGYYGGNTDKFIQVLVNLCQGLPGMSLMIVIAAVMPENDLRLVIAVTVTSWAGFSRIVRSEVIRISHQQYIESARSIGAGSFYILRRHVFPNAVPVLIVLLNLKIGTSLLSASALSYLGLGVSPPVADWGVMISDARVYFRRYPLMILAPGICITSFCMAINLVGDGLSEMLSLKRNSTEKSVIGG